MNLKNTPTGEAMWPTGGALKVRKYGPYAVLSDTHPTTGKFAWVGIGTVPAAGALPEPFVRVDDLGRYIINPAALSPKTVPYVNAFIADGGHVVRDWRAAKRGEKLPARLYRLAANGTTHRKVTDWTLRNTQAGIAVSQQVSPSGTVTTTAKFTGPVLPPVAAPAPAPAPAPVSVAAENKPADEVAKVETPATVNVVVEVEAEADIPVPPGYVLIKDLLIKERDLVKFRAAMQARFTTQKPHYVLAVGPTGVGKTDGLIAMGEAEGYVVHVVGCFGFETTSDVYGAVEPNENGQWDRLPSTFWNALKAAEADIDKGVLHLIILDELTRARVAAQNGFIDPLHGLARLQNPVTGDTVLVGPNVTIAGTANIGAAYAGAEALDAALRSRFAVTMNVDYLPEAVEASVIQRMGLSKADAETLAKLAKGLRDIDKQTPFRSALVPGTRDVVQTARQALFDPEGIRGAWIDCIVERFSDEGRDPTKTEKARVVWALNQVLPPTDVPSVEGTVQDDQNHEFVAAAHGGPYCERLTQSGGYCGNLKGHPYHIAPEGKPFIHINPTGHRP